MLWGYHCIICSGWYFPHMLLNGSNVLSNECQLTVKFNRLSEVIKVKKSPSMVLISAHLQFLVPLVGMI